MSFGRCHNCDVYLGRGPTGRFLTVCEACDRSLFEEHLAARKAEVESKLKDPCRVLQKRVHAMLSQMARGKKNGVEGRLGYSYRELKAHLENRFTPGMSWDLLVCGEIHIDHIVPVAPLRIDSIEHPLFRHVWGLGNLQPLWARDNLQKSDKFPEALPPWYTNYRKAQESKMSLEDSMKELAESNLALAKAMNGYAKVITEHGTQAVVSGKPAKEDSDEEKTKPQTAAEKKAAKAAAEKAAAKGADKGDDDGFGDEDNESESAAKAYTHDEVKALLVKVKNTNGDKEEALDLIRPLGYQTIPSIQEKDFGKVVKAAEAWLKKNG